MFLGHFGQTGSQNAAANIPPGSEDRYGCLSPELTPAAATNCHCPLMHLQPPLPLPLPLPVHMRHLRLRLRLRLQGWLVNVENGLGRELVPHLTHFVAHLRARMAAEVGPHALVIW